MSIPSPRRPEPERPRFDMVLRGYDRIEVDQYVAELLEDNAALRRELDERGPLRDGDAPAVRAEPAAPPTQLYDIDTPAEDSFGFRAEKLLRLAEREAAEMRTRATRDAESLEAGARRRSEDQLRAAEKEADEIRSQATQDAARLKKQASQEAARLSHLHGTTKTDLRRLHALLGEELNRPDPVASGPDGGSSTGTAASNH